MKALTINLFVFISLMNSFLYSQCTSCYNIAEALLDPQQVKTLNLNAEGLSSLPREIERITNLESLILSNNRLTEVSLDFSKLTQLTNVDFSNNPGFAVFSLPESFYDLPIVNLNLSHNAIQSLPSELGSLTKLQNLDLGYNNLTGLPLELSFCKKLNTLLLNDNQLNPAPCMFCDYWALQTLDVSGNKLLLLPALFQSLMYKDQLKSLRITNLMYDEIPAKQLVSLPIEELVFSGSIISSFDGPVKQLNSLKSITFDNCQLTDPATLFRQLNNIKSLETIEFKHTDASAYLREVKNLKKMVLQEAKLEDPKMLNDMASLENIELVQLTNATQIPPDNRLNNSSLFEMSESMLTNTVEPVAERPAEEFKIPADSPCEIKMSNSSYAVPKNAFLTEDGTTYEGSAKIVIKEHTDPILMALEGLPMVINQNNTNELFSSNGMIEFTALDSNNRTLRPNPKSLIMVTMKDQQPDQQSKLFTYDGIQRNWQQLAATPRATNLDSIRRRILDSLNKIDDSKFVALNIIHPPIKLSIGKKGKDPHLVDFSYYFHQSFIGRKSNLSNIYYQRSEDADFILKQKWRMDVDLSKEWLEFQQRIKNDAFYYKNPRKRRNFTNVPRPIQELTLIADKKTDNFLLSFNYKGERKQIPIYLDVKGSPSKIQSAHLNFHKKYQRLKKKEELNYQRAIKRFEGQKSELAKKERERIASLLTYGPQAYVSQEQITFGLSNFGLANCDYFSRNRPDQYITLSDKAIDQNGDSVEVPDNIRNVLVSDNTYLVTGKNQVPVYGNKLTFAFFIISATEIAIIRSYEKLSNGFRPLIERLSIKNLSSLEIRDKILGL